MIFEPSYLKLHKSGELEKRVQIALEELKSCKLCPRNCAVDRTCEISDGFCQIGRHLSVSKYFAHFGEEDVIKGSHGSGTIFFSSCNLKCSFCQNYDISWERKGQLTHPTKLAQMMMELQNSGCHNINLVTPSHVTPQILEGLLIAVEEGLNIPIVYNTSGYDSIQNLKLMDGIVDIYMPDFKFWNPETGYKLARAPNYGEIACNALKEMHRQVGDLIINDEGIAQRGLLVRHLIMPNEYADTEEIMNFIANEISPNTYINLMAQYHSDGEVNKNYLYSDIDRRVSMEEYQEAVSIATDAGLKRLITI